MNLELTLDADKLRQALLKAPGLLERNLDRAIGRVVLEVSRAAKKHAPKASSTLTNAIGIRRPSKTEGIVFAGVQHAEFVEKGTRGGKFPSLDSILDWVLVRGIKPKDADTSPRDLAFMIARGIAQHGTPAQPFMQPALEENLESGQRHITNAIDKALSQ